MTDIQISVVMGVYNEASQLANTIQSVLMQQNVSLEFIIVNDGSSDDSANIVRDFAKADSRVKLIEQSKQGLTKALINGCNKAKGQYIARQDAGDVSLPGRFRAQLDVLSVDQSVSMISTGTQFIGPNQEQIYQVVQSPQDAKKGMLPASLELMYGPPHHGSVMFRRTDYQQVGGYREEFSVAQDLDLWSRLAEVGSPSSLTKIYYQAGLYPHSISSSKRQQQVAAKQLIIAMSKTRRNGGTDQQLLSTVEQEIASKRRTAKPHRVRSDFYYFLAANLLKNDKQSARKYFKAALRENPLNLKAWIRITLLSLSS